MPCRSMLVMLMLANVPAAIAATRSEPPVTPAAKVAATAEEQVPAEEPEPDGAAAVERPASPVSGDPGAQPQFAEPLPGPATAPPDVSNPAEPPSCIPRRSTDMRRGFVRLLAEIARAVVR